MAHNISDQRNGGPNHYSDMKIGIVPRSKLTDKQIEKLDKEYNSSKLSSKQKQSFWRTNSIEAP